MPVTILMTRCSRKRDLALALELRRRGHIVYATAPRVQNLIPLQAHEVRIEGMDLKDWESVKAMMARLQREHAAVDVVVNNAAVGNLRYPPPPEELHRQFDADMVAAFAIVNLFGISSGPLKRIVNVVNVPDAPRTGSGAAFDDAVKTLRKLSQAQRETLAPFGVEVTTVQLVGVPKRSGSAEQRVSASQTSTVPREERDGEATGADPAVSFASRLADAILAVDAPAAVRVDGSDSLLQTVLRRRPQVLR